MRKTAAILGVGLTVLMGVRAAATAAPNPLVVTLHRSHSAIREASATIFDTGSRLLVNLTEAGAIRKGSAVTLNAGGCDKPGAIAFSLSRISANGSLTELRHSMSDLTSRAHSMVVHRTSSESSAAQACGTVASSRFARSLRSS